MVIAQFNSDKMWWSINTNSMTLLSTILLLACLTAGAARIRALSSAEASQLYLHY
jgi:hypothetical protein